MPHVTCHMFRKRGSTTLASLFLGALAAVGSFFPSAPSKAPQTLPTPAPTTQTIPERADTTPAGDLPRFQQIEWKFVTPATPNAPRPTTKESPPRSYLRNLVSTFTAPFEKIGAQKQEPIMWQLPVEQFWRASKVVAESGTVPPGNPGDPNACPPGVDSIGGRTLPETHNGGNATGYGSPRDEYFRREYFNNNRIGTPALAENEALMNQRYPGMYLSESDSRIVALRQEFQNRNGFDRPVPLVLRLNPDFCYISARWSYRNPQNTARGSDASNLYTNGNTRVILHNTNNSASFVCVPVDWGPGYNENNADFDIPYGIIDRYGSTGWDVKFAPDQTAAPGPCDGTEMPWNPNNQLDGTPSTEGPGAPGTSVPDGIGVNLPAGVGAWRTKPQCYKHMGPAGGSNQYNAVLTCNAGHKWEKKGETMVPVPLEDCGKRLGQAGKTEKGCEESATQAAGGKTQGDGALACLWLACKKGNNAIWDPQSKICGCDDGGSGLGSGLAGGAGAYNLPVGGSYGGGDAGLPVGSDGEPLPPPAGNGNIAFKDNTDRLTWERGYFIDGAGERVYINRNLYTIADAAAEQFGNVQVSDLGRIDGMATRGSSQHNVGDAMDIRVMNTDGSINREQTSLLTRYIFENGERFGVYQLFFSPVNGRYTLNLAPDVSGGRYVAVPMRNQRDIDNHYDHAHVGVRRDVQAIAP